MKLRIAWWIVGSIFLGLIALILFVISRTETLYLWSAWGGVWLSFLFLIGAYSRTSEVPFNWFVWLAIGARILAWISLPSLSDDYFRFVWDGRLWTHGINPFLEIPSYYMASPEQAAQLGLTPTLFEGLNSPEFFTIYPPVLQGIFAISAWIFPESIYGSVWVMKFFLLIGEMASLYFLYRLLQAWEMPISRWLLYALNPLIILETIGNVHFEGLMICFLLAFLWLLHQQKIGWAAFAFSLAVCTKLLPLMFMPLLLRRLGWGKTIRFGIMVSGMCILMFLPIFDRPTLLHMLDSVDLYFSNFEFNASLWYLIRETFASTYSANLLTLVGPYLGISTVVAILIYTFLEPEPRLSNLGGAMMWTLSLYLLFASIVHPWYLTTLVAMSILTSYRWPIFWGFIVVITYATYRVIPYDEWLWGVVIEYIAVMVWMGIRPEKRLQI
ncbi:MAG: glycosyltransferase 87 family protein, partial [Bacteroidota bacterium]